MTVVIELGAADDVDREDRGQRFEPVADPILAVGVGRAGGRIEAAQKRASHTSVHAMVDADRIDACVGVCKPKFSSRLGDDLPASMLFR